MRIKTLCAAALSLLCSTAALVAQTAPAPSVVPQTAAGTAAATPRPAVKPVPKPVGALAGKVTRSKDGTPLAGASVSVRPTQGGSPRVLRAGSDGGFRVSGLREGFWDVKASAPGMVDGGLWRIEVAANGTAAADLALDAGGRVEGTVVGEDGAPIAGAAVLFGKNVKTDAEGRFTLFPVPPNAAFVVGARAAGHVAGDSAEIDVRSEETAIAPPIVLATAGQLVGTVSEAKAGKPLAGAAVYAYGDGIELGSWGEGKTDAKGQYRIDGLRAGRHTLTVTREGYESGEGSAAEVVKGQEVTAGALALALRDPMLAVYANQKVFLPTQKARIYVNGFRTPSFTTEVFAVDPVAVLAAEKNLEKLSAIDLAGKKRVRALPAQTISYKRALQEVHGRPLILDPLPPGTYVVRVRAASGLVASTWIQSTDLALVAKESKGEITVYACDLASSKARAGVTLTAYPAGKALGTTDASGILRIDTASSGLAGVFSLWASDPAHPEQHATLYANGHDEAAPAEPWRVYFETDRPIYRPGQTVFYKGTVRADDRGTYLVRTPATAALVVTDAADAELLTVPLTVGASGAFDGKLELPVRAALGFYNVEVKLAGAAGHEDAVDLEGGSFRVEEYRKPEFKVAVTVDPPAVLGGAPLTATIEASYYFGGPVADASVDYDVYSSPYWSGPLFADAAPCADCWTGWDDSAEFGSGYGEFVLHGSAKTDGNGRIVLPIPTKRPSGDSDLRYKVVARLSDPTGREVEDSASAIVSRARFALDVETDRYVVKPEDEVVVHVRAADFNGKPVATAFTLRVLEERWVKGKASTLAVSEHAGATGADGKAELRLVPGRAGYLKMYALAKDDGGRLTDATQYLWSAGEHWVLAEYPFEDVQIVTDKRTYRPGDIAKVLVNSAVPDADVLFTIEGDTVREARVLHLVGASQLLEIPIGSEHLPTIHFGATLVAKHRFAQAEKAVPVSPEEKILAVKVTPERDAYRPGETAAFRIETRDAANRGVPAEVSVAVVDEAIFALSRELVPDVRQAFYGPRPNRVATSYSFPMVYEGGADKFPLNQRRRVIKDTALWLPTVMTGADGTARVEVPLPDNLTTWRATARAVTLDTRVGEARGKTLARKELMVRFATPRFLVVGDRVVLRAAIHNTTAAPLHVAVRASASGTTFEGPSETALDVAAHGVSTWDVPVRVAAGGGAAGGGESTSTLILDASGGGFADGIELTLPVLPFGAPFAATASGSTDGTANATLALPAGADPAASRLALYLMPSLASGLFDALDKLDTYPYGCIEQTLNGFVPAAIVRRTLRDLAVSTAVSADTRAGLERLDADLPERLGHGLKRLAALQHEDGGWGWWEHDPTHPYLTAYAVFGLGLMREAGEHVDEVVLTKGRHALDQLLGIGEPQSSPAGGVATDADQRAWMLYALARSGELDDRERDLALALAHEPGALSSYGRALLTSTLAGFAPEQAAASAHLLLAAAEHLPGGALVWKAPAARRYTWVGSNVEATAYAALALLDGLPAGAERDAAVEGALRMLVQSRRGAWWVTTKDTAAAILATSAWLRDRPSELAPDYRVRATVNGTAFAEQAIGKQAVRDFSTRVEAPPAALRAGDNTLAIVKDSDKTKLGKGEPKPRLYYSALLQGVVPGATATPVSAGFTVGREYRRAVLRATKDGWERSTEPFDPTRETLHPGERLEVHVTVRAAAEYGFVMIEDPLPSGFEVEDAFGREDDEYSDSSWQWWFARREVRDDRVSFFATSWPAADGANDAAEPQEFVYTIRAEVPGEKHVQPATASLMYFPEVRGTSGAAVLRVE